MKKVLCIFVLFLFLSKVYSQSIFGIRGGINHTNLTNTLLDYKNGAYFGVLLQIPIKNRYSMQPEVYYSSQGGKSINREFGNLNIDYISVTFVNKFYFTEKKNIHFIIGPGLDYFVSQQIKVRNDYDNEVSITPIDLNISGGIGFEFNFGLILEIRYKQGVNSTDFLGSRDVFEEDGSQLNSVFQAGIAYKFKID